MPSQSSVPEVLTTSVEGRKVAWRVVGDGPPAILLHGGHGSWRHWARNIASWSGVRRLLIPDMPGFGDSDDSPFADMAGFVGLLAKSIDQLPTSDGSVDLVGFSFGGLAAAHLAWGDADVTVTPAGIPDIIHVSRPNAGAQCADGRTRVCVVPAAGHWGQYEAGQSVNELLLQLWQDTENSLAGAGRGA